MAIVDGDRAAFTAFFADEAPRLHRAFTLLRGPNRGWDATAEAMAWAWANWAQVQAMENPVGHLYRVGSRQTRRRLQQTLTLRLMLMRQDSNQTWFPLSHVFRCRSARP